LREQKTAGGSGRSNVNRYNHVRPFVHERLVEFFKGCQPNKYRAYFRTKNRVTISPYMGLDGKSAPAFGPSSSWYQDPMNEKARFNFCATAVNGYLPMVFGWCPGLSNFVFRVLSFVGDHQDVAGNPGGRLYGQGR
jgi:hypothetical protein